MNDGTDESTILERGEIVDYDGGFVSPESPLIPVINGIGAPVVQATRRVLDEAAHMMGREIIWLPIEIGDEAEERAEFFSDESVRKLKQFRLGIIGPIASNRCTAARQETELQRRVGLTVVCNQFSPVKWNPNPPRVGSEVDLTVFRNLSGNVTEKFNYGYGDSRTLELRDVLSSTVEADDSIPPAPAGFSVTSVSASETESLVDIAMEFALDRDRNSVTIAHQGDLLPATEGSFLEWTREYLSTEYAEAIIDEATFLSEHESQFPDDEIVVMERHTDEVVRQLLTEPEQLDVVIATGLGGRYLSTIAGEVADGIGVTPGLMLGDGRVLAHSHQPMGVQPHPSTANPIGLLLSSCQLLEYIGWDDVVAAIHRALSKTLNDGIIPGDFFRESAHGSPTTLDAFVDAVIERIDSPDRMPGDGGSRTSADERSRIRRTIAGIYNILFEDQLTPSDIELNQLLGEDEEAEIYLPEVGINFYYWRRWAAERRLEVLLHELAHVEQDEGERDHGSEFYDRLVELTEIATDWKPEIETLLGESIEFQAVHRFIVESVHEETIEPDLESVQERKRILCREFNFDSACRY